MKYDNNGGVKEFILRMVHVQTKLKTHNIDLNENFIMPSVLNYLPAEFTQIKTSYNTFGDKWSVNKPLVRILIK